MNDAAPWTGGSAAGSPPIRRGRRRIGGIEVITAAPADGGRPLLLVHGAFAAAWMWDELFLPIFAQAGFDAWALSLRGHGGSFGREHVDRHGIDDYVEDLATVAAAMGGAPALIGHSMGGFVVQKYLERERAPAAVLMASVPPQGLCAASFSLAFGQPALFVQINRLLAGGEIPVEVVADALFVEALPPERLQRLMRAMNRESQRAIWDMSLFNLVSPSTVGRTPLLVLGTEHDRLIPSVFVRATARCYGVQAQLFAGLGHGFPLEAGGERVARSVVRWLRDTPAAW
jgi:pimeloyl-ACP methyl ester carboxylesterase